MKKLTFTKQVDTELPAEQHVVALKNKPKNKRSWPHLRVGKELRSGEYVMQNIQ